MPTAYLNLRHGVTRMHKLYACGLTACGFKVVEGYTTEPRPGDVLVTWNVSHEAVPAAQAFKAAGQHHIVTENSAWGNEFDCQKWKSLALGQHNTAGRFPIGPTSRWDLMNVKLADWRPQGETLILAQRGIGQPSVAMPKNWIAGAVRRYGGRVRQHPGKDHATPLEVDLIGCGTAVTWGSGAAIKALALGVRVISEMPNWIGEQDNTNAGRLAMFQRLAWAQWRHSEIESGEAFKWVLQK